MILEALYHGMIHPEETYHPMTEGGTLRACIWRTVRFWVFSSATF